MKRSALALATAIALAAPAFAQSSDTTAEATDSSAQYYTSTEKMDLQASELIGSRVYATEAAIDADKAVDKPGDDWDDIGEVNNLIVGRDGSVKAVVVGVGGFLGLGEKNVALRMADFKFLKKAGDDPEDYYLVVKSNKESLEKAPEYKIPE